MNNYYDRNRPTDAEIDRAMARFVTPEPRNRLERLLQGYAEYGYSKPHAIESIVYEQLLRGTARGHGNAARRRIERLNDEAEARMIEQEWYEANRLSEADVDALAAEWEYRNRE